ncbi:MAG: 3-phosphoglycerate dehydrogenase [Muribaculaceae bacterium]|nr:3-phosphoglycerate dehydrogenase [Muribaculaceae bacterium]
MKVLIATEKPFSAAAVAQMRAILEEAGHEVVLLEKYSTPDELRAAAAEADAMIVRSDIVDAEVIANAPKLKLIVRAGAGYDNIDLARATEAGIVVENTPGQNANAVAELVVGLAVMAARNGFNGTTGFELGGRRLGLHAFGAVSRNVVPKAKGLGMQVSAFDPFCKAEVFEAAEVAPAESLEALYAGNDIVSIHIPATEQTRGSIGKALIGSMPKGAVLVNTARKEVINEAELAEVLAERPDLKYFADVKPSNADELAERFPGRVFFTPKKTGAQTAEANLNAGVAAARQTVAFFAIGDTRFRVNK